MPGLRPFATMYLQLKSLKLCLNKQEITYGSILESAIVLTKKTFSFSSLLRATALAKSHGPPCVWLGGASMPCCPDTIPAVFSALVSSPSPRRPPAVCFGLRSPAGPFLCNPKRRSSCPEYPAPAWTGFGIAHAETSS